MENESDLRNSGAYAARLAKASYLSLGESVPVEPSLGGGRMPLSTMNRSGAGLARARNSRAKAVSRLAELCLNWALAPQLPSFSCQSSSRRAPQLYQSV